MIVKANVAQFNGAYLHLYNSSMAKVIPTMVQATSTTLPKQLEWKMSFSSEERCVENANVF